MKKLALAVAATTLGTISTGIVLSILWRWFIVPLGAPAISAAHAMGLVCTITLITLPVPSKEDEEMMETGEYYGRYAGRHIIAPWIVLAAGWILMKLM